MSGRGREALDGAPREDRASPGGRRAAREAADAQGAGAGVPRFLRGAVAEAPAFTPTGLSIQRAPAYGAAAALPAPPPSYAPPSPAAEAPAYGPPAATPTPGMIVDDAAEPGPGQMRKGEFLALLHGEVCAAADQALAGTVWSTVGCPYVDRWVEHYAAQDAAAVEAAVHRHVPEARGAAGARDYVPLVAARVRTAVARWVDGDMDEADREEAGGADTEAPGGGLISRFVGMFFKGRSGDGRADASPQAVRARLGRGQALDGGIAARMGSALGRDFSRVRVHTDARAGALSDGMSARAFTVGEHVAFAPGEYRPGTPVGDALIAHELAHVAQQEGAASSASPASPSGALEEEADRSAVGAVARLWTGAREVGSAALPALRSGLRLQRCSKPAPAPPAPNWTDADWATRLPALRAGTATDAEYVEAIEQAMRGLPLPQVTGGPAVLPNLDMQPYHVYFDRNWTRTPARTVGVCDVGPANLIQDTCPAGGTVGAVITVGPGAFRETPDYTRSVLLHEHVHLAGWATFLGGGARVPAADEEMDAYAAQLRYVGTLSHADLYGTVTAYLTEYVRASASARAHGDSLMAAQVAANLPAGPRTADDVRATLASVDADLPRQIRDASLVPVARQGLAAIRAAVDAVSPPAAAPVPAPTPTPRRRRRGGR